MAVSSCQVVLLLAPCVRYDYNSLLLNAILVVWPAMKSFCCAVLQGIRTLVQSLLQSVLTHFCRHYFEQQKRYNKKGRLRRAT